MDEDDEFGDLYSDVLPPFNPPDVLPPPPTHHSTDLNLQSQDQDFKEANSTSVHRVSKNEFSNFPAILESTRHSIGDGEIKDMNFDIEDPYTDSTPVSPGLATDRDGGYGGEEEGGDWDSDSDSEDDLQIVLNDNRLNVMIRADRRSMMGGNEDEDDEDDEEPLVIVGDTDSNQLMKEHLFVEEGLQAVDGDGKEGGEAGKGSAAGPSKTGYSSHGYHPFHSKFKYVRPGAAPMPGGAASTGANFAGQFCPPANLGPMAGRGRGDWRPHGIWNVSAAQKGFHQPRGLDFTLPSHRTIFEVDMESFEEKPWRYPGIDITDYFNLGLNEESWKEYCKQLEQLHAETKMQIKIRVYESGRTDKGYDPDMPPELAAETDAQGVQVDTSNLVKLDTVQGDSVKVPAHVQPSVPPGRPISVDVGSGERLPSIDTRPPRMRDLDSIIEVVCQDSHEDEPPGENGAEQADCSLPGENVPVETSYDDSKRPSMDSAERSPAQDEPSKSLLKKQDDEVSRSTDSGQSFRSSSSVGDATRSPSADREEIGGESGKDAEIEETKMSYAVPQSEVEQDDGGESKTESSKSSKARSESHRDYQQLKDGAEEEVIHDKHNVQPASNRKQHNNNAPHQSRKNQGRVKEVERTRVASKSGKENSNPRMENSRREEFDKRKEQYVDGGFSRRKKDDPYSRRGEAEGSRKRDREDDRGTRKRVRMQENETHSKDDQIPSRKHLDHGGMRNSYEELDDHISKGRKDEEYMRRSRPEKNETSYNQRKSISRLKREQGDKLEHQKRDVHHKIRDDFDDHSSLRHKDDFYTHRDGNEKLREREDSDKLKLTHKDGLSARGRVRGHRGLEDPSSRIKDEYKENLSKDTTKHTKQTKKKEYPGEESSSHHGGHEDYSACTYDNLKKPRRERTGSKSDKVIDSLDGQQLQDKKHKDLRRKIKEQSDGTKSPRSKQMEQNGVSKVTGSKGTKEARNRKNEIPQQPNPTKRRKENPSSGDALQDLEKGRTKLELWASHKERDDAVPSKTSSNSSKLQEKEKCTNDRLSEHLHSSVEKNQDVTVEKSVHDLVVTNNESDKGPPRDQHLDTVEKLKKRSARFKLPMPTENDTSGVKKTEFETLPSAKAAGPVDLAVKSERPTRKRRWTSN